MSVSSKVLRYKREYQRHEHDRRPHPDERVHARTLEPFAPGPGGFVGHDAVGVPWVAHMRQQSACQSRLLRPRRRIHRGRRRVMQGMDGERPARITRSRVGAAHHAAANSTVSGSISQRRALPSRSRNPSFRPNRLRHEPNPDLTNHPVFELLSLRLDQHALRMFIVRCRAYVAKRIHASGVSFWRARNAQPSLIGATRLVP